MHRKRSFGLFLFVALAVGLCLPLPAHAQSYGFSLDQAIVDVWLNPNGTVSLEYWLTFTCDPGAHPIDVVDLGLPNSNFSYTDIRGDVDGTPIARVDSDYQGGGSGAAVWLGSGTIAPGRSGTVHIIVDRVGRMFYQDSDDTAYASMQFSPVWFDGQAAHGTTDATVRFHLPPGVQPEEPRWHSSPSGWPEQPETALDAEGRVLYTWYNPAASPSREYIFGASFPAQYVEEGAVQQPPSVAEGLFAGGAAFLTSLAGCICNPITPFFVFMAGFFGFSIWANNKRKMQYLPPLLKVEGVGIKRGLTAVEAAILLEAPLNKVMTMVLFGLLKKGAVTVLEESPLRIQANTPQPEGLHPYEEIFVEAIKPDGTLDERKLESMMVSLVKMVNTKMKGFSRRESVAYYKDILRRAWTQVEAADTPEVRSQRFNDAMEFLMLDRDFDDRTRRTFITGPFYVPPWWIYHRPWAHAVSPAFAKSAPLSGPVSLPSGPVSLPTLPGGDFAARIVRGIEGTAGGIVGNLSGFTSKVTSVTNPPPKPSSSGGGRSSSGGGCACACACAGCACACAGGGR
ncbi:MAG: hypothetical protein JXD18_06210 [Anaerolineae bacterium]|nr:hypothetical protein [Anaerolineae bacterium]